VTPAAYPRVALADYIVPRSGAAVLRPYKAVALSEGARVTCSGDRKAINCGNTCSTSRAGSPLLFGLAPRGVFRASDVAIGAVGSYPTFSPLPNEASESKTSRRSTCGMPPCCFAGGLFSVALSVSGTQSTDQKSVLPRRSPDVIMRVALFLFDQDGVRTLLPLALGRS